MLQPHHHQLGAAYTYSSRKYEKLISSFVKQKFVWKNRGAFQEKMNIDCLLVYVCLCVYMHMYVYICNH